jgi:hypothetical protein
MRRTRYNTPIYRITPSAQTSLYEHVETVPWWLFDRVPQGFSGRAYAKQILKQNPAFSVEPRDWSDEIVLRLLAEYPVDSIGNLLVGDKDLVQYKTVHDDPVSLTDLLLLAGQSKEICHALIAGEQPKFCCYVEQMGPCIVKFAETEHQADLLIAEHLALSILNAAGISAAQTTLFRAGHYQFLIIRRFDCVGGAGRCGVISLKALDMEFVGSRDQRWPVIARQLVEQGIVATRSLDTIERLFCFGRLIANSDMHSGNLSFFDNGNMPFVLTPAYDQLPMAYAASDKQKNLIITVDTDLSNLPWNEVLPLALRFWKTLSDQTLLSRSFRDVAVQMFHYVQHDVAQKISGMLSTRGC